jgi:DMSO/TMAO reductase YedYZ molybdopterin-dependent catalytic subunit
MGDQPGMSRRALLGTLTAAGIAAVGLTAGQSFGFLAPLNLFAPRVQGDGPQRVPVNTTAKAAGVVEAAQAAGWALIVRNGGRTEALGLDRLHTLPQTGATLPIACVEGWSTSARWSGVPMRDLLALVGAAPGSAVLVTSLQPHGAYRRTTMGPEFAEDPATLVALTLNDETLDLDHGFPARVIAPGRPGVLQTKWLSSIEVMPA